MQTKTAIQEARAHAKSNATDRDASEFHRLLDALPAGAYTIASATANGNGLRVQCAESNDAALRLTTALSGKSHPKLVFHRYGQRYFLAEVWSSDEDGRKLMMSKQERAIQKEYSRLAANKSVLRSYETVAVALAVQ